MKNSLNLHYSKKFLLLCFFVTFQMYNGYSQMVIKEIKVVYKSKVNGRIISEKEFKSCRGAHVFHKLIKGKKGVSDTLVITPPKVKQATISINY